MATGMQRSAPSRFVSGCAVLCAVLLAAAGCSSSGNPKVPAGAKSSGGLHAVIETDKGEVEVELLAPEPLHATAEALPLTVVFEDEDLLVIDKPAGMVVHAGASPPPRARWCRGRADAPPRAASRRCLPALAAPRRRHRGDAAPR